MISSLWNFIIETIAFMTEAGKAVLLGLLLMGLWWLVTFMVAAAKGELHGRPPTDPAGSPPASGSERRSSTQRP